MGTLGLVPKTIHKYPQVSIIVPSATKVENVCVKSSFKDYHLF